ncbi:MAG: polymer-forming cytoskeletal protein [Anaerolineales bacterium]|nr:polymer-forming cytoskeletal protein [Anaerolineales bacterium]MDW8162572.1 polymer-forming cytoskeletal protein [Anaerolineales bacterium]
MFRKRQEPSLASLQPQTPVERINSILGTGISWKGSLSGSGGLRIEGAFDGNIALRGVVVVGESGRVTCEHLRANTVIIAGMIKGNITAERVEIRSTGRVWGDVVTTTFATEEGAFLRGQICMEEKVDLGLETIPDPTRIAEENRLHDEINGGE